MDKIRFLRLLLLLIPLALLIVACSHTSSQQGTKTQAVALQERIIAGAIVQPASPPSIVATLTMAVTGSSTTNTTGPDWLNIVFGLVGGLVGVAVGALLTARQQNRQNQRQVVYDLYAEYHSKEMLEDRIKAECLLEEHKADFSASFLKTYEQIGIDDWFYVSRILHFFEKYAVFYNEGHLDKKLARATLHHYFMWWYEKYLKEIMSNLDEKERIATRQWVKPMEELLKSLNIPKYSGANNETI